MTPNVGIFAGCLAAISLFAALTYRYLWAQRCSPQVTPTGFGVLLAPALLAAAVAFEAPPGVAAALVLVSLAAAVYWLDDLKGLSAQLRVTVSFAAGIGLSACLLAGDQTLPLWLLVGFCVAAGVLNVMLTNIVNFYDGADLNLATFIALTAGALLLFAPAGHFLVPCAVTCLAFIAPFAVMNSRPKTIYLGDGGSFVFACFLTMIAVVYVKYTDIGAQVAIPLALPMLDTGYVLCVRIIEKHDLMTRNYLHLYQQLNRSYAGFSYLLPQFVNAGLVLGCAVALQMAGLSEFLAVATAMVIVTVPFYFGARKLLLLPAGTSGDMA